LTIIETWSLAFDPIQVVLGLGGIAAIVIGLTIRAGKTRQNLGRRLLLAGFGLVGAAVVYSLVLTWSK